MTADFPHGRSLSLWTFVVTLATLPLPLVHADLGVEITPDGSVLLADTVLPPRVVVHRFNDAGIDLSVRSTGVTIDRTATPAGTFLHVRCPESPLAGDVGTPALPVVRKLFATPPGTSITFDLDPGYATLIDLPALGYPEPIWPLQGPLSLDPLAEPAPPGEPRDVSALLAIHRDDAAYNRDEFTPTEFVSIRPAGIVRGWQLHLLEVRPVLYNAARGELALWPQIAVSLHFAGGDAGITLPPTAGINRVVLNPPPSSGVRTGGNYLIVTAELYADSAPLNQFIDAKTASGLDVTVYTAVTGTTREAIKAYIASLWGTPDAPDYLMIIGDALSEFDQATANRIPTWVGTGSKSAVGDIPYACMDGEDDWFPDMALGRFPVQTVDELQNQVNKSLYVESGEYADPSYAERAVFIAGTDTYSGGTELHDEMIAMYMDPRDLDSTRLYATEGADTQDVIDAIDAGCFLASYFGHADGYHSWWSPLFEFPDIESLQNENLYPFLISFSCSCTVFHYTDPERSPGFLEKWLLEENKGAAATYGCATNQNPYTWTHWQNLYRYLFQAFYADGIRELGPACQAAAGHFVAYYGPDDPASHDFTEGWYMLGDPSLRLPDPPPPNYLIIAAPNFASTLPLAQFIGAKQAMGFNVMTYSPPSGTSNNAIKTYIESLWGTPDAPAYILIVGDTSGYTVTSTTIPHFDGGGSKAAATDWPYGCMPPGLSWYPDIPVGRFSVANVTQLQNVINKSLFVENGNFEDPDYVKRGNFLANPSTYGTAEPTHDWVINNYLVPSGYTGVRLYSSHGADTQDVADAVNAGALWTVYFGHSSSTGWWDPSFDQGDVNDLSNEGLYGVAFGWSCNTARYTYDECFGETWLRAPNKGSAAYISASNYIYWSSADEWLPSVIAEQSFFASFFEDDIWLLGPAWVAGSYRFLTDYGSWDGDPTHNPQQHVDICRNFLEEFVILGDPALRLPQPNGFTLAAQPATHYLCCPPSTQAMYTIDVGQIGTFDEAVTLTVSGVPFGATVDFDNNSEAPPFSSLLTVGNLQDALPDEYDLVITGSSASKERSIIVQMDIADTAPDTPTLLSPLHESVDIDLMPELVWQAAAEANEYQLQIATSLSFSTIVYQAVVSGTSHELDTPLGPLTEYFWRIAALNACGSSTYSAPFSFTTVDSLMPSYYNLLNGESGTHTYFDDTYNGDGDNDVPLAPLSNGLGDLTDGVIATQHWNVTPGPYVGWKSIEPTITFHFGQSVYIDELTIYVDDSGGGGGVFAPTDITIVMGFQVRTFSIADPPGGAPFAFTATNLDLSGTSLDLTLLDDYFSTTRYLMLSEVEFNGGPNTGACCTGDTCTVRTEIACLNAGGQYQGNGTDCDPNPCITYDSACLILSEVVQGHESGECPRWVEITNTGVHDFAFLEGGLIIQTGSDTDVHVDVDLAGVIIPAGESFVVNSNFTGVCTGAFDSVYPESADFYTGAPFGYGTERIILTDSADGSHLIDIYGEFGVDGAGQPWEFTTGYSYRLPPYNAGTGQSFDPDQWYFGGVGSLVGPNPTQLLLDLTTPGVHLVDQVCGVGLPGDMDCDGDADLRDINPFVLALNGQDVYEKYYPDCIWLNADCNGDQEVSFDDINAFVLILTGGGR